MTLFRNDSLSKFFMMWFEAEEVFPCHLLPDQNRPHDFFGMKRIIEEGRYFLQLKKKSINGSRKVSH